MSHLVKKFSTIGLICLLAAAVTSVTAAEKTGVKLSMKAEKEIMVTDADGNKSTKRIEITTLGQRGNTSALQTEASVIPGDEVIYTITYRNASQDTATDVVVTNPIPVHMEYQNGSAQGANTKIEFSVDGKHFSTPDKLTVKTADGKTRHAQAEDYTHVRWTVTKPLAPGQQGQLSYRAVLQ